MASDETNARHLNNLALHSIGRKILLYQSKELDDDKVGVEGLELFRKGGAWIPEVSLMSQ